MVVDNLQNIGIFYTINSLWYFIVIHQDNLFLDWLKEIAPGYNTDQMIIIINNH